MRAAWIALLAGWAGCLAGCGGMLKGGKEAKKAGEAFVRALFGEDGDVSYEKMVSKQYRQATPQQRHVKLVRALRRKLGRVNRLQCTSWRVWSGTGGTTARLLYAARWDNGQGQVSLHLVRQGGAWKVHGFNVSSPALLGLDADTQPATAPATQRSS